MIPLDGLLHISSGFGNRCKSIFFTILIVFSLGVCGSYHKPEFFLQSVWMAWNLTCWYILTTSELIQFWSSSVDFPHFGIILTKLNRPNLQLPDIFWRLQERNGLNLGMLMYPDHLQNLLNFGHGLLIFLILASFWHSETGPWRSILMCNKSTSAGTSLEGTPIFAHVMLHCTFNPLGSKCPWWQDVEAAS